MKAASAHPGRRAHRNAPRTLHAWTASHSAATGPAHITLRSGNFGTDDFFTKAFGSSITTGLRADARPPLRPPRLRRHCAPMPCPSCASRRFGSGRFGALAAIQRLNSTNVMGEMVRIKAMRPVADMTMCSTRGALVRAESLKACSGHKSSSSSEHRKGCGSSSTGCRRRKSTSKPLALIAVSFRPFLQRLRIKDTAFFRPLSKRITGMTPGACRGRFRIPDFARPSRRHRPACLRNARAVDAFVRFMAAASGGATNLAHFLQTICTLLPSGSSR